MAVQETQWIGSGFSGIGEPHSALDSECIIAMSINWYSAGQSPMTHLIRWNQIVGQVASGLIKFRKKILSLKEEKNFIF